MSWRPVTLMATMLALVAANCVAAEPKVAASIKPVHAIAAAVMEGIGTPELILGAASSPHTTSLRPSQARTIESADIVFWIGEELELFLARPLQTLGSKAVSLMDVAGVSVRGNRHGGTLADDPDHHHHSGSDPHIWLDPQNAAAMARAIRDVVSAADPQNAVRYGENTAAFERRLAALSATLATQLGPLSARRFVVFHDAFQYFEIRFGLASAGVLTVNPDMAPGAGRLRDIRERIAATGVICIFSEPQFEPKIVSVLAAETGANWAELDPLGTDLPPGPDLYFSLLENIAGSFEACLSGGGGNETGRFLQRPALSGIGE